MVSNRPRMPMMKHPMRSDMQPQNVLNGTILLCSFSRLSMHREHWRENNYQFRTNWLMCRIIAIVFLNYRGDLVAYRMFYLFVVYQVMTKSKNKTGHSSQKARHTLFPKQMLQKDAITKPLYPRCESDVMTDIHVWQPRDFDYVFRLRTPIMKRYALLWLPSIIEYASKWIYSMSFISEI